MRAICLSAIILCLVTFYPGNPAVAQTPSAEKIASSELTFKCIETEKGTFGYDIYTDGKMLIHQPTIPGVSGNLGFRSKDDAEKVARLVVGKLKKKLMPPTVSVDELRRLKVIE
jgi:hypothetical protein